MWLYPESLRVKLIRNYQKQLAHLTTLAQFGKDSEPETPIPCQRAGTGKMVHDVTNEHILRSQRYYGTQQVRPNVPVFPQPNAEDTARRSQRSRVWPVRSTNIVREVPGQSGVTDLGDITSDLRARLPSRSNGKCRVHHAQHRQDMNTFARTVVNERPDEGDIDPNWTRDENFDEEQSLGEDFEMVQFEGDLTEGFEDVDRDIPTAFNGKTS
ncbi:hypothetical protein G6011_00877 [Alternaria panax]|uniref:Uncharacterized protein n=1 Tax=Alternaria panax TaxID=48097 RepID=A0AAD4NU19_9PLEO|nr:hypothetical protein G6011_00877 [Alternaria panax]